MAEKISNLCSGQTAEAKKRNHLERGN